MFQTDDFDEALSQFEFPEECNEVLKSISKNQESQFVNVFTSSFDSNAKFSEKTPFKLPHLKSIASHHNETQDADLVCAKPTKRKIIDSLFDRKNKRKFPGPAGLLSNETKEARDENIFHIEIFSQDIDSSQDFLRLDLFESSLWVKLLKDVNNCNLKEDIDSISAIKQQALLGNLKKRKAQIVTAFVETVDRSVTDPLITLRDTTGTIKCTLHRDAWSTFSSYIVSECCALVLSKPTVLTTGSSFKKHYLNITLSNIHAIYSFPAINDENSELPDEYIKECIEEHITVIKRKPPCRSITSRTNGATDLFNFFD